MITLDLEQKSTEWIKARLGIPTASNFDKIVTTKGEPSKQAQKYMYQLAGERVSCSVEEGFENKAMIRGSAVESEARNFYELIRECSIQKVGICYPDDKRYACSPDGLIGDDGLIEIKCPNMATHVGYLLEAKLPNDYFQQVHGQLFVTGRKWCDFISYYPGIKPFIVRVEREENFISLLKSELEKFCNELETLVKKIS